MADQVTTAIASIATAIIGVAILSVVVSKNSNTVGVINAGSSAYNSGLATALTPITGSGGFASNGLSASITG